VIQNSIATPPFLPTVPLSPRSPAAHPNGRAMQMCDPLEELPKPSQSSIELDQCRLVVSRRPGLFEEGESYFVVKGQRRAAARLRTFR